MIDRAEDHGRLQLERLAPPLRLAREAVQQGELKATGPLTKAVDRIDRRQTVFVSKAEDKKAGRTSPVSP